MSQPINPTDLAADNLAALEAEIAIIADRLREAELGAAVPHLPRWKVRDVIAHLGGVHRWATRIVTERSMDGPAFRKSKLDGAELCDWFDAGGAALLDTLRSPAADEPCPNFNPGSAGTVGWWIRRQLHETTIHRWDVEVGLGISPSPIPPARAIDAVDEFLDVFVRTRGKHSLDSTVALSTTRPKRVWTLTPAAKPGRIDVAPGPPAEVPSVTTIVGRPADLLLALWGRYSTEESALQIDGDADIGTLLRRD